MAIDTVEALEAGLAQFVGSGGYCRLHPDLYPKVLVSDGAKYLAEHAGAAWLLSLMAGDLPQARPSDWLVIGRLVVQADQSARLEVRAGEVGEVFAAHDIGRTDFPLAQAVLYAARAGDGWVMLLPLEY